MLRCVELRRHKTFEGESWLTGKKKRLRILNYEIRWSLTMYITLCTCTLYRISSTPPSNKPRTRKCIFLIIASFELKLFKEPSPSQCNKNGRLNEQVKNRPSNVSSQNVATTATLRLRPHDAISLQFPCNHCVHLKMQSNCAELHASVWEIHRV